MSVLTIYWVVVFDRTASDANGINVWYAAFLSGALVVFGVLSDRLHVRKPFMLIGGAATIVMMAFLVLQASHPHAGYHPNVVVMVLLAITLASAYSPWMAGYTEQVEWHNPALTTTGLAVWGWILRIVVAVSFLVLPLVVTTATTLVDNQASATVLQAIQAARPVGGTSNPQVQGLIAFNPLALAIQHGRPVGGREIAAKVGVHRRPGGVPPPRVHAARALEPAGGTT